MAVTVSINGKREDVEAPLSIAELLQAKRIRPEVAVIAVNNERIAGDALADTMANDGDRVDIMIQLAGGGVA
jgi:thiamine biosynthesis protein ThiS